MDDPALRSRTCEEGSRGTGSGNEAVNDGAGGRTREGSSDYVTPRIDGKTVFEYVSDSATRPPSFRAMCNVYKLYLHLSLLISVT
jgi:hypothetical protein